jgi:hypothetical protein
MTAGAPMVGERVWARYEFGSGAVEIARFYSGSGQWVESYEVDRSEVDSRRWFWGIKRSHLNGLLVGGSAVLLFLGILSPNERRSI